MSDFGGEGGGYTAGQSHQHQAGQKTVGKTGLSPFGQAGGGMGQKPVQPRPVSSLKQELVERPLQDIGQELAAFANLNALLEINPQTDSPEEQSRKQQLHARWQQMSQEEQQVASQTYQREMQRKQLQEREAQQKAQQQAAQKTQLAAPSSPSKGPVGPASGNKKKAAAAQLQQNRQSFNKVQSSG